MQFDLNTTLIAISVIISVLGLQMLVYWSRDRQSSWVGWVGGTFLLGALSLLFYLPPVLHVPFIAYGVGNALRIAAFAFLWIDVRMFCGRRAELAVVALSVSLWLALCSTPNFLASLDSRVLVTSALIALFLLLGAFELWRDRNEYLPSRLPTIAVYLSFAAFVAFRVLLLRMAPFPTAAMPIDGKWLAAFSLIGFVHVSFLVGFTLSMTRERSEIEQRRFALSDPLTGLLNRRAFLDEAARSNRRRHGSRDKIALLVLDLDHFKLVNDRFGHEAGDVVLQSFADAARRATRAGDLLYRMGGEEFCFVLPGASTAEAGAIAERIRTRFEESFTARGEERVSATVSIGVASSELTGHDLEQLLIAGDSAVYEAKAKGRNRTVVAQSSVLARPASIAQAAA
jgi:diguanylate cyclase (GGDEF)-like protein